MPGFVLGPPFQVLPAKSILHGQRQTMVSLRLSASTRTTASWALRLVANHCSPQPHHFVQPILSGSISSQWCGSAVFRLRQRRACGSRASPAPDLLPLETPVDEERFPGYKPEHYYPANPGDILENRYQLSAKIGWGSSSTVWLAHDIRRYSHFSHYYAWWLFTLTISQWQLAEAEEACRCQNL